MFLQAAKRTPVNLEEWAVSMMERHNRKSHLAPQLSPSTQALLRGEGVASPSRESAASTASASKTPTSSEVPIVKEEPAPILTSNSEPPMSSRITDVNGSGMYPEQPAIYDSPGYPPRTSSSSGQSSSRARAAGAYDGYPNYAPESGGFNQTLPIRPAPPSGPLPQPPGSAYGNAATPRSTSTNGSNYAYGDGTQYQ